MNNTGGAMGLIVIGVTMDLYSLLRELEWNRKRHGPSGCGILSLFLYTIAIVIAHDSILGKVLGSSLLGRCLGWLVLVALHISLQYLVPGLHQSWLKRKE